MKQPTLGNPQNTIAVLQKYNFVFQKKFGQNFLIDTHVLDKIIRAAQITEEDCVLEIGPGIGTMTQYLACAARRVIAVEIDRALIPILEDTLEGYENIRVINEDVLKVDIAKLAEEENGGRPIKAGCRPDRAPRTTAPCRWLYSIMQIRISWQMCRLIVLCPVRRWGQR